MKKLSLLLSAVVFTASITGYVTMNAAAADSIVNVDFEDGSLEGWSNSSSLSVAEGHGGKYMTFNLSGGSGQNTIYSFESQNDTFTVSFDLRHEADSTLGFQFKLSDRSTGKEVIGPNVVVDLTRQSYFQYHNGSANTNLSTFRAYAGSWYRMTMIVNPTEKKYDLYLGGYKAGEGLQFRQAPDSIDSFIIAQNGSDEHKISIDNLRIDKGAIPPIADTYYEDIDFDRGVHDNSAIIKSPTTNVELTYSEIKESSDLHGKYYAVSEIPTTQVKHTHMLPVSFTDKVTAEFDFMVDPSTESPIQIRLTGSTGTGTNLITYNGKKNEIAFYNGSTSESKYTEFYPGKWYTITLCVTNPASDDCKYDAYINGVKYVEGFSCRTSATVDRIEFLSHTNGVTNAFNIDNIKLYGDIVAPAEATPEPTETPEVTSDMNKLEGAVDGKAAFTGLLEKEKNYRSLKITYGDNQSAYYPLSNIISTQIDGDVLLGVQINDIPANIIDSIAASFSTAEIKKEEIE